MAVNNERGTLKMEPYKLYPLTTIASIDPVILQKVTKCVKQDTDIVAIKAIEFNGNTYVLEGYYEILAANILNIKSVPVEFVDRKNLPFWNDDKNIEETLKAIGISTLYDFETIGGFVYEKYPLEYRRG